MPQCIRAFKCTVQGTHAFVTRNPVLGGFVGQESREGYGYTSINTTAIRNQSKAFQGDPIAIITARGSTTSRMMINRG